MSLVLKGWSLPPIHLTPWKWKSTVPEQRDHLTQEILPEYSGHICRGRVTFFDKPGLSRGLDEPAHSATYRQSSLSEIYHSDGMSFGFLLWSQSSI